MKENEESLGDALARRLNRHGLLKNFFAAKVCEAAKKISKGEFEPVSFRNGALKVTVNSSGRGHILKLKQKEFIEKINTELGKEQVERIVIVVNG
jgi:hypothetical protein